MQISKRKMVVAALSAAVAGWLVVTPVGAGNGSNGAVKLEGAWIARGVEAPLQWTYVLSPDPSGRQAALHGSIDVGLGGNPFGADYASPLIGNLVLTSPDTARFNSVWYGITKLPPAAPLSAQIVYIGMNSGEATFVDGQWEVTHHIAYYLPSSDADKDGLPDPGTLPAVGPITVHTVDTRVPLPH
jgi:hypothetical protein